MRVTTAFLATSARVDAGGLLQVEGGLWDRLEATRFPAEHPFHVVALLDVLEAEVRVPQVGALDFTDPRGGAAGSMRVEVSPAKSGERVPVVMPVLGKFSMEGRYEVALSFGGREQVRLGFQVHLPVPAVLRGPGAQPVRL